MIASSTALTSPVRCGVFFTRSPTLVGFFIRYFTRPFWWIFWKLALWQHCGLVFADADRRIERHEALMEEGWHIKPWDSLVLFANQHGNHVRVFWLDDIPALNVGAMWRESCSWEGKLSYDKNHIAGLALINSVFGYLFLRPIGLTVENNSSKVFCSEGVTRLLCGHTRYDLRDSPEATYDSVTPYGAYLRLLRLRLPEPCGTVRVQLAVKAINGF